MPFLDQKCKTGINGLDTILGGGFPIRRLYLIQGEPGTGKTTLALNFLLEGVRNNEKTLYLTFSETKDELESVARSHGWDLSSIGMLELSAIEEQLKAESQNTIFHPSEVELNETVSIIKREFERVRPTRLVFDSVSEMRLLAGTSLTYRRQMLELKQYFTDKNCTVLLLDDLTASPNDLHVQSIVHGVINLQKLHPEFGDDRRRLNVVKLRGVNFSGGFHDYKIKKGGINLYPRMVLSDYMTNIKNQQISSGIPEFDSLLGGGLDVGTSNLFLGPAGTGKSTLSMQFAIAAAKRGERVVVYAFEESMNTLLTRAESVGMDARKYIEAGLLEIIRIDPAQLTPGEFADNIRRSVIEKKIKLVVMDSLNGYLHAMPQEKYLTLQLHELLSFLGNQGVVTIMILAQQGMMGPLMATPIDVTYLADTVVITRFFEAMGAVKKALSILKKRGSVHENTIREFTIGKGGILIGEPLVHFQGVLSGVPSFVGQNESIMRQQAE